MNAGRRLLVAALAACSAVALGGCGGGQSTTAATTHSATQSSPPRPDTPSVSPSRDVPTLNTPVIASVPPPTASPVVPPAAQLATALSTPVEDPYYAKTSNPEIDVLHYFLDLSWNGSILQGRTTITARGAKTADAVQLDLSRALKVSTVRLDRRSVNFRQAHDALVIDTGRIARGSTYTLTITYSGTPHSTPAPSSRPDMAEGLGWVRDPDGSVHTFQEPFGAFTWYPVNDHPSDKALYDARITTPRGDIGVFNGTLTSRHTAAGATTTTWHLDQPAASYLITLAIGPYEQHSTTTPSGMKLSFWLEPRDQAVLAPLEREATRAYEWLIRHTGSYPFSTLGIVVVGGSSAMETQTLITLSRGAARYALRSTLEHEMAHEWFGDTVTPVDWRGLWLNEGWAMYMQQWYEADTGRHVYGGGISKWRRLDLTGRRHYGPPGHYDPQSFAEVNVYLGPAMMLNDIRKRVGNRDFNRLVKQWPAEHSNSNVDRGTFANWLQSKTGEDFRPLLHRWLDSPRTPR